jgi:hypothetical protein
VIAPPRPVSTRSTVTSKPWRIHSAPPGSRRSGGSPYPSRCRR